MNTKLSQRIGHRLEASDKQAVIKDRRFLDDEQLIYSEQVELVESIFNAKVRDAEIEELIYHFTDIFRGHNPVHLIVWGMTGTGKTLTIQFFLTLLNELCRRRGIDMWHEHLDLSTPRPCFRALNDLACQIKASKRYKKGISLEEMMYRIEDKLRDYEGHFVLFVDECDHIRHDFDTFYTFLIRRLPQRIKAKLTLILASNKIDWPSQLDPRVKSFLRNNELLFKPYNAEDLQHILQIRVKRALHPGTVKDGVIEKIAAMACREHGDARKAVTLLSKSADLAEKKGSKLTLQLVDQAAKEIEQDQYLLMIRTAPVHLQATMAAIIVAWRNTKKSSMDTRQAYDSYRQFCSRADMQPLTIRAFGDFVSELDTYGFIRSRVLSRGRGGRSRDIVLELPMELEQRLYDTILLNLGLQKKLPDA